MDDKGLVDLVKLRRKKNRAKFRGKNAYCFVEGNKLIKIYATNKDWNYGYLDGRYVNDLSMFKADTIVFPDSYIYENEVKCGEIQEYINNCSINTSFNDNVDIELLINNYEQVIEDLLTFSNIIMCDLCSVNVLYSNNKGFHLIDTTEWEFGNNTTQMNIYRLDKTIINRLLLYLNIPILYGEYNRLDNQNIRENTIKFGHVGINFYKLLIENIEHRYHVVDLLYAYKDLYLKYCNQEMKTFKDMNEFTKVLKKG